MGNKYYFGSTAEMDKRKLKAEKFYYAVLDPEEIPYLVTDEATLYAIYYGDEAELIKKIKEIYKVDIQLKHFKTPFWQLLDLLDNDRNTYFLF